MQQQELQHTNRLTIRLLGGCAVYVDGRPIEHFRSVKIRALLAYLALHPGRAQLRSHLATLLWGEFPESNALTNLRNSLARLRKSLTPQTRIAAPRLFSVTAQSIALCLDNQLDFVDVQSFDCLIQAVRTHHHPHLLSCPHCLQSMTAAVELYQGELLAGLVIDEPEFTNWLRHAADTRYHTAILALEHLADHALLTHHWAQAQGWAQRHLALQPWAESAHRKLMLCLAARGEQGALHAHYQQLQTTLETELGLAPSPQTVQLFRSLDDVSNLDSLIRQVIAADHPEPLPAFSPPTLQWSAAVTARLYGFFQLDTPFWGREAECAQLRHQIVEQNDRVVVLTGMGGVGKTRLAQEMAQQLLPHFTDGACFVSLSELSAEAGPDAEEISLEQTQVVRAIAHAVGLVLAPDPPPLTQLFYYFAQRRLLLVLDNVERRPALLTLVSELLRRAPRLVLLLTSRHRLPIAAAFTLRVSGFSVPNPATSVELSGAVQFFCQEAQRHAAPLTLDSATLTHIASICRAVWGLPLALKLAAHLAVHRPCAEISQNLWEPGRLSFLESPAAETQLQSLRTVFNGSWQQLSAPLRSIYVRCSLFSSSFGGEAAAAVAGASAADLIALCDCSLLERDAEGLLALHPLLREYAAEYALVLGLLAETQRSYTRYWLQQVASSAKQELGGAAIAAQLARLDPYLADLQQAWWLAVKAQELDLLTEALPTLERFFRLKMHWQEGDHLLAQTTKLLASHTSENLQIRQVSVQIATARVRLLLLLHQRDIALSAAERAVLEATALAEPVLLVPALIALGHARSATDELEQAERLARQALALAETTQNFGAAAEAEVLLSKVLRTQNHTQSACVYAESALRRYQQIGDDSGALDCIRQLILGYKNFGSPRAQQLLRQGIALAKAIENLYMASHFQLIFSMGFAVYEGLHTEALAYCRQIQSDPQIRMIPELASRSFYVQAWIEANLGRFDAARASARQGLQTAQAADLAFCQAKAISVMAAIEYYAENFLRAYRYAEELREFAHTANLPSMSRDGLLLAAHALLQMGRVQSVRSTLHELDRLLDANELIYQSESNALHAQLALAANDLPQCRHYGQALWGYLQQNVCAFNHVSPFFLYWTSYRALHVVGDPAEQEVLAQANGLLDHLLQQLKAGNCEADDSMLQQFIENNRWHRELRQAWHSSRNGL